MIEDDLSRGEISRSVGVDVQTLRDWAIRYNAEGLDGLRDAARPGRPPKLDESQTAELVSLIETGSYPDAGEPSRWTPGTIQQWIKDPFDIDFQWKACAGCFAASAFGICLHGRSIPRRSLKLRSVSEITSVSQFKRYFRQRVK